MNELQQELKATADRIAQLERKLQHDFIELGAELLGALRQHAERLRLLDTYPVEKPKTTTRQELDALADRITDSEAELTTRIDDQGEELTEEIHMKKADLEAQITDVNQQLTTDLTAAIEVLNHRIDRVVAVLNRTHNASVVILNRRIDALAADIAKPPPWDPQKREQTIENLRQDIFAALDRHTHRLDALEADQGHELPEAIYISKAQFKTRISDLKEQLTTAYETLRLQTIDRVNALEQKDSEARNASVVILNHRIDSVAENLANHFDRLSHRLQGLERHQ